MLVCSKAKTENKSADTFEVTFGGRDHGKRVNVIHKDNRRIQECCNLARELACSVSYV